MNSQLPVNHASKHSPTEAVFEPSNLHLPHDNELLARSPIAAATLCNFETTPPMSNNESKGSSDMNYHMRVTLLEQDLMNRSAQLNETLRANAHLAQLRHNEATKVFELTQALQDCERRTAKSEIAVEYLADLNVQITSKVKEIKEPDPQISALKEQLQRSSCDAQKRILALEVKIQNLNSDNEKLKAKLECAMGTIMALSSFTASSQHARATEPAVQSGANSVQHNNLIDLMDDCLVPDQRIPVEAPSPTLLDETYDSEEIDIPATTENVHCSSDSFDSDFSNSSYIVRFKGFRDTTKEKAISRPLEHQSSNHHKENDTTEKKDGTRVQKLTRDFPLFIKSSSDHYSAPSEPASPSSCQVYDSADSSPTGKSLLRDLSPPRESKAEGKVSSSEFNMISAVGNKAKDLGHDMLIEEDYSEKFISKDTKATRSDGTNLSTDAKLPNPPTLAFGKVFPMFKSLAEKRDSIYSQKKNSTGDEKTSFPAFFKYGIQFHPRPREADVHRTLLISNIASNVTLSDLLDRVRGGVVLDAKRLYTKKITGSDSALVTFIQERAALAYHERSSKHPISLDASALNVSLLTPTWPIKPEFLKKISDHQMTRCLEVYNFPKDISQKRLIEDLQICPNIRTTWVTFLHLYQDGLLKLHFSSIVQASHAHRILSSYKHYATCTPYFVPDPCAQPLETLNQAKSSTSTKAIWERNDEAVGENKKDHRGFKNESKEKTHHLNLFQSQNETSPLICKDCQNASVEKPQNDSNNYKAVCSDHVVETVDRPDGQLSLKDLTSPDKTIGPKCS